MRRCPARVPPGQLPDQLADLLRDLRASGGVRIGPFVLDDAPVPGKQGGRCHDPVQPKVPGQQPCERCDHGPVSPVRRRPGDAAAQDRDFMPQYQDLHVLGGVASGEEHQPAEQLQTGINALLAILTRFGAGGAARGTTVMNDALGDAACAHAMLAGNSGAVLTSCMSPKDMLEDFGAVGLLLAPLAATGGLADFFASEFQGSHDIWTREDQYTILINGTISAAPPCLASLLFTAAVAGQHFSTNPAVYPPTQGQGPGAYDPICDGNWAIALVSHPHVGTTDGEVVFRAEGGSWRYVGSVGGVPADCILEQNGVPASVAKVLWPPSQSQPASYCGQ